MTTLPPTADRGAPDWLPDEATLNRLAGEFFRALPGQPTEQGAPPVPNDWSTPSSTGLPAGHPQSATPTTGMSTPAGPPPTSAAAPYVAGAPVEPATLAPFAPAPIAPPAAGLPLLRTQPAPPVQSQPQPQPLSAPTAGLPGTGSYYFLTETPEVGAAPEYSAAPYYFVEEPAAPTGPAFDRGPGFDVLSVRRDFPILSERVNGHQLIWLDNAATTQKPQAVMDRLVEFYSRENSNIHRAAHELAARATDAYEGARRTVARFIGAGSAEQIVFVRGTTEAINLVAKAWGPANVGAGDEIVISHLEHHANIVPWQMLVEQTGAVLKVIPVDDDGQLLIDEYAKLLSERTKIVAVTQLSNALGTIVPVEQIVELGHRAGARVLIDAAQSVPHLPIDVTALDADFLVFSGHKLFGPTGIGVLYGKRDVLEDMPPWEGGGNMIADVTLERSVFQPPPNRFEAGTGNIADAVGLGAAIEYVERLGLPNIAAYEHALLEHATAGLREVPGIRLVGTAPNKASIVSFVLDGYQPTEVGTALNEEGIAVRAGHHCAQPILRRLGLEATVRPSFAFYNTHDEVDTLVAAVHRLAARRNRR
jgi:cysteine desulfurase/selenocysteine lyase